MSRRLLVACLWAVVVPQPVSGAPRKSKIQATKRARGTACVVEPRNEEYALVPTPPPGTGQTRTGYGIWYGKADVLPGTEGFLRLVARTTERRGEEIARFRVPGGARAMLLRTRRVLVSAEVSGRRGLLLLAEPSSGRTLFVGAEAVHDSFFNNGALSAWGRARGWPDVSSPRHAVDRKGRYERRRRRYGGENQERAEHWLRLDIRCDVTKPTGRRYAVSANIMFTSPTTRVLVSPGECGVLKIAGRLYVARLYEAACGTGMIMSDMDRVFARFAVYLAPSSVRRR